MSTKGVMAPENGFVSTPAFSLDAPRVDAISKSNAIHVMSAPIPTVVIHGNDHVHAALSFPVQITASQDCVYKHLIDLPRHGCKLNQCFCITLLLLLIHTAPSLRTSAPASRALATLPTLFPLLVQIFVQRSFAV